jgi:hypothetical protein
MNPKTDAKTDELGLSSIILVGRTGSTSLFMPVLVAIQRSPQIRAAYEAMLARGKKKKVAIIALMRRLLHALWAMLHHQQDFNPHLFHALPANP